MKRSQWFHFSKQYFQCPDAYTLIWNEAHTKHKKGLDLNIQQISVQCVEFVNHLVR
jgi:hypothetical protein